MGIREIFILAALSALVCANEIEDSDQKKRGAGKTSLNSIPTGGQKPEYTYSIYPQSNSPTPSYQQAANSFYPAQGSSQYYTPNSPDATPVYSQQPQLNFGLPQSPSQFVPLNLVPNSGYQAKYQLIPTKSANGNIQLMIIPQQSFGAPSGVPYSFFTPNSQFSGQSPVFGPQAPFNVAPNYQQVPLGGQYLGQPSTMLLYAQPNNLFNNNLLYPNPVQSLYNLYSSPTNAQAKYVSYGSPVSPLSPGSHPQYEYEKPQGPALQGDNDIAHSSDYVTQTDSQSYNKNSYNPSANRNPSYSKS